MVFPLYDSSRQDIGACGGYEGIDCIVLGMGGRDADEGHRAEEGDGEKGGFVDAFHIELSVIVI